MSYPPTTAFNPGGKRPETNPLHFLHPYPGHGAEIRAGWAPRPQVVWAKLEHVLRPIGAPRLAVLDCIDADWFADIVDSEPGWLTRSPDAGEHVSIVVVALAQLEGRGRWHLLELADDASHRGFADATERIGELYERSVALQSNALLAPPRMRLLDRVSRATRAEAAALGAAGSLSQDSDATTTQLEEVLGAVPAPDSAAVFDVGQGNFNALLKHGTAILI